MKRWTPGEWAAFWIGVGLGGVTVAAGGLLAALVAGVAWLAWGMQ